MNAVSTTSSENEYDSYGEIYEQYVVDTSFLWILRSQACVRSDYIVDDLRALENRIDAKLNGLMTSHNLAWQACEDALELHEPGEVFTAMVIAMRSHESYKVKKAVESGFENESAMQGLISAIGWLPLQTSNIWIERFLGGKEMRQKYLGLASCSVLRKDPGKILCTILRRKDCMQDEKVFARALRLVGELRRQDCMPFISQVLNSDNDLIRFWANWSAVLLGHHSSAHSLKSFVFNSGKNQTRAIELVFRILPVEQARDWISEMSSDNAQVRQVIKATGILGDPHAVNWLISKMKTPSLARIAGESFSIITGIDFIKHQLEKENNDKSNEQPNDDVDDINVYMDEDENLAYPDMIKIATLWQNYGKKFIIGQRYFLGKPITSELLKDTLKHGVQRHRHAAALELALTDTEVPLFNTRARI